MPHAALTVKWTDESPSLTPNRTSSAFVILQANRLYSVDPGTVMLPESTHPFHSSLGPDSLRDTESYPYIASIVSASPAPRVSALPRPDAQYLA